MWKGLRKFIKTVEGIVRSPAGTAKVAWIVPLVSVLILSLAAASVDAAPKRFFAVLNAGQEVDSAGQPASDSPAFGVAFLTLDDDQMLCYSISYSDLEGEETAAHFHAPFAAGVSGRVLFAISPNPSPVGSPKTGCVGPLSGKERRNLMKGLFYINVHSTVFTGGEIRGQVLPAKGVK